MKKFVHFCFSNCTVGYVRWIATRSLHETFQRKYCNTRSSYDVSKENSLQECISILLEGIGLHLKNGENSGHALKEMFIHEGVV